MEDPEQFDSIGELAGTKLADFLSPTTDEIGGHPLHDGEAPTFNNDVEKNLMLGKFMSIQHKMKMMEDRLPRARFVMEKCESPMEQLIPAYLVTYLDYDVRGGIEPSNSVEGMPDWFYNEHFQGYPSVQEEFDRPYYRKLIYPQVTLTPKEETYRADFLAVIVRHEQISEEEVEGRDYQERSGKKGEHQEVIEPQVVIEVDGHDYHEKTKEQAKRDKQRDRAFTSASYEVMRFTGSELHENASAKVMEIDQRLDELCREHASSLGERLV
jgi:very-short-patch-repair endonuclease